MDRAVMERRWPWGWCWETWLAPQDHSVTEAPLYADSPAWDPGLNLMWKMGCNSSACLPGLSKFT